MILAELAAIAAALPAPDIAAEASDLDERYSRGMTCVACVGQFKRGKSTLLNALLGTEVLPVGTLPVTAAPVLIRFGAPRLRARIGHQWEEQPLSLLPALATADVSNMPVSDVSAIELQNPAQILSNGLCLLDTPGLGSSHRSHDTETHAALPRIDAVMIVIGADPPLSGAEVELVQSLDPGIEDLIIVLNKADRVSADDAMTALDYASRTIQRETGRRIHGQFVVSAIEVLRGDHGRDWPCLLEYLSNLTQRDIGTMSTRGILRARVRLGAQLQRRIVDRLELLDSPLQAAAIQAHRLAAVEEAARRSLTQVSARVKSSMASAMLAIWHERELFMAKAISDLNEQVASVLRRGWWSGSLREHRTAFRAAAGLVRHVLQSWDDLVRAELGGRVTALRGDIAAEMENMHDELSRTSGITLPSVDDRTQRQGDALDRHYFNDLESDFLWQRGLRHVAWRLLPARMRERRLADETHEYVTTLIRTNTTSAIGDANFWVGDITRHMEAWMAESLTAIKAAATTEQEAVALVRERGAQGIRLEKARLLQLTGDLEALILGRS